jgi:RHS repeat-associated protein
MDNHLGCACLELDGAGAIISYEEYYPYGSTSYQSVRSGVEVSAKRYRYTGKERDEETSLYHHGMRYYAPWLARWTSCDPLGIAGGINIYAYVSASPIRLSDPSGTSPQDEETLMCGGAAISCGAPVSAPSEKLYTPADAVISTPKDNGLSSKAPRAQIKQINTPASFGDPARVATADHSDGSTAPSTKSPVWHWEAQPVDLVQPITTEVDFGSPTRNYLGGSVLATWNFVYQGIGAIAGRSLAGMGIVNKAVEDTAKWARASPSDIEALRFYSIYNPTGAPLLLREGLGQLTRDSKGIISDTRGSILFGGRAARSGTLGELTAHTGPESRVYQLVDVEGGRWRYGETVDVRSRLNEHARDFEKSFRGMEIISDPMAKPNALALEGSLGESHGIPTLSKEPSSMYKLGGGWIPEQEGIYGAGGYLPPSYTLLNPAYYPWVKGLPWP